MVHVDFPAAMQLYSASYPALRHLHHGWARFGSMWKPAQTKQCYTLQCKDITGSHLPPVQQKSSHMCKSLWMPHIERTDLEADQLSQRIQLWGAQHPGVLRPVNNNGRSGMLHYLWQHCQQHKHSMTSPQKIAMLHNMFPSLAVSIKFHSETSTSATTQSISVQPLVKQWTRWATQIVKTAQVVRLLSIPW